MNDGSVFIEVALNSSKAEGQLDQFGNKAAANIGDSVERAGAKGALGIGKIVAALGLVKVAGKAIDMVKGSVDAAFGRIDTMNAFSRTITTITGDSAAAGRALDALKGITKGTAYGLDVAAKATQNFVTRGMNLESATKSVGAWADAVAFYGKGTNEELASVTDALAKMRTKGKVEMDQLNRLFDVGIDAVGMYAQAHNMSASDVQDALSKGSISAEDFLNTVENGMLTGEGGIRKIAGAAKEAGASWAGTFANMKSAVTRGTVAIIQALDEGFGKAGLGTIKENIAAFGAKFEEVLNVIAGKIPGVIQFIANMINAIKPFAPLILGVTAALLTFATGISVVNNVSKAITGLKNTFNLLKTAMAANPFLLIIAALVGLGVAFVTAYNKSETFRNKINSIAKVFEPLISKITNFGKVISTVFEYAILNFTDFQKHINMTMKVKEILPESVFNGLNKGLRIINQVIAVLKYAVTYFTDFQKHINMTMEIKEFLPESIFNGLNKGLMSIGRFIEILKYVITYFTDFRKHIDMTLQIEEIMPKKAFDALNEGLRSVGRFIEKLQGIGNATKESGQSIDIFGIAFKILKAVFLSLLGPIGLAIKAFELIAKALGGGDINKGIDSILQAFDGLAGGIRKNAPLLGSSFGKALEGILKAIGNALPGIISGGLQIVSGLLIGIAQGLPMLTLAAVQLIGAFTGAMLLLIPTIVLSATAIIVAFLGAMTVAIPQIIIAGAGLVNAILQGITEQLPSLIESAANLIVTWLTALNEHMPEILQAGFDLLISFLKGIADNIGKITDQAISIVVNFAQAIANRMDDIVNVAVDLVVNFLNGLTKRMPDIIEAGVNFVVSIINGIANNLDKIINAAGDLIIKFLQGIAAKIPDIVNAAMDLVDAIVKGVIQAQDRLFKAAINLVNGMADNIKNNKEEMKNAAWNLLDAMISVFVPDALWDNGKALAKGLLDGLVAGFEAVKDTVSGWADWIAEHKGPISYDKKLLIKNGQAIVYGLNRGLIESFSDVKKTVANLTEMINETATNGIDDSLFTDLLSDRSSLGQLMQNLPELNLNSNSRILGAGISPSAMQQANKSIPKVELSINVENVDMRQAADADIEDVSEQLAVETFRKIQGRLFK